MKHSLKVINKFSGAILKQRESCKLIFAALYLRNDLSCHLLLEHEDEIDSLNGEFSLNAIANDTVVHVHL